MRGRYYKTLSERGGFVLVIPKVGANVAEHFAHTYALAQELSAILPTAVIAERVVGDRPTPIEGVPLFVQNHAESGPVRRAGELLHLVWRLRKRGYRTFFVRTSQTAAVPTALLTRLTGGRTLYWNCGEREPVRLLDLTFRELLRGELPLRLAFRITDRLVTGTPSLANHYADTYHLSRKRIEVVPNEIALSRYQPPSPDERAAARYSLGLSPEDEVVLSVHRLSPMRRAARYLSTVVELVAAERPQCVFLIAGEGPEEGALRRRLARSDLSGRARMLGAVPHRDIARLYHAADVFVMPSYSGEGFPRVLLEAMAMGLPIASMDVGGVSEILPEQYRHRLVDRNQPERLADEVLALLDNPRTARDLSAAGLEWVSRYDAPVVARLLARLAA